MRRTRPPPLATAVVAALTIAALGAGLAACSSSDGAGAADGAPAAAPWALVWADEFDGDALDTGRWIVVDGAAEVNGELQYYAPDDVYLEGGHLVLRTQRRPMGGRDYTSGEVRTGERWTVSPGSAVEWRTHPPGGKGIWPANWLVHHACTGLQGCGANWPPEIDVLELRGSQPTINVMTHWWGRWPDQQHRTTTWEGPDLTAGFHTYRVEWFPDSIVWFVDGVRRAAHAEHVTTGRLQLVMNTAVGGHFDGPPDATTPFPRHHRIDWVRVYRYEARDSSAR